nr:hypothetical protein [Sinorhizobium meliloti]
MRRVVVPFRIKLRRLHEVLQAAMGLDQQPPLRVPYPRRRLWSG